MNRRSEVVFGVLVMIGLLSTSDAAEPKRVAVLVGINQNQNAEELECAEWDAKLLAKELEQYQFQTSLLIGSANGPKQATLKNIQEEIDTRINGLERDDILLVGLFGYGQRIKIPLKRIASEEQSFFYAADSRAHDASSMLNLNNLFEEKLGKLKCRKIVFVDACRGFPKEPAESTEGIDGRLIKLPENTSVFFSCRAGQMSYEDSGPLNNGVFGYALLHSLRDLKKAGNQVRWFEFVARVRDNFNLAGVENALPRESVQDPILAGRQTDFVFLPGKAQESNPISKIGSEQNLTGLWRAKQSPAAGSTESPLSLVFLFIQQGDVMTGVSQENYTGDKLSLSHLYASIEGRIQSDGTLSFEKLYDGAAEVLASLNYKGRLSADGRTISEGVWKQPGDQEGSVTFERIEPENAKSVTGIWYGQYFYPNGGQQPAVDLELFAIQTRNKVAGFMREPNTFGAKDAPWLYATVEGNIDPVTAEITFTKVYDGTGGPTHAVEYSGKLSTDARLMLEGEWKIGGFGGEYILKRFFP